MIFKRMLWVVAMGVVLLTLRAALSNNAAATDHPAKEAKKTAPRLPAPGTYTIDPVHSFAYFGAWHHVVGLVRGRFEKVEGTITVSQDLEACGVDVTIDASSISTQNSERDEDLRGPDFFDAKKFPAMMYRGRGIRRASDGSWLLDGSLTIRGVTKAVPLTFTFNGAFPDTKPGKPTRVAFHGTAATKRAEFGMVRDNVLELGVPPAPGSDVAIEIDVEADATNPKQ
ncbi:MAG TPA: YceI family protein [Candidatus Acidoferrum sp.]|nr:YceI family protein [Candidatus Acidoferrum sp.]